MSNLQGAPHAEERAAAETTVKWFDVTQDAPTLVVGMVKFEQGEDPMQWTEVWYCYPGLQRASAQHPLTRFTLTETTPPGEPPACEYIDTHTVVETPPLGAAVAEPIASPLRIGQIDTGWFQLRATDMPPELWGQIHVTPGSAPDETLETWQVSAAYQPLSASTTYLSQDVVFEPNGPQPFQPDRIIHHVVVKTYPTT